MPKPDFWFLTKRHLGTPQLRAGKWPLRGRCRPMWGALRRSSPPIAALRPQGPSGVTPHPPGARDGRAGAQTTPDSAPGWVRGPGRCSACVATYDPPAQPRRIWAVLTPPGALRGHWSGVGHVGVPQGARKSLFVQIPPESVGLIRKPPRGGNRPVRNPAGGLDAILNPCARPFLRPGCNAVVPCQRLRKSHARPPAAAVRAPMG